MSSSKIEDRHSHTDVCSSLVDLQSTAIAVQHSLLHPMGHEKLSNSMDHLWQCFFGSRCSSLFTLNGTSAVADEIIQIRCVSQEPVNFVDNCSFLLITLWQHTSFIQQYVFV